MRRLTRKSYQRVSSSPTLDDTTCMYQREVEVMPERHHPVEGRESVI
jgi:5-deoxy-D-glucuronate isomerase